MKSKQNDNREIGPQSVIKPRHNCQPWLKLPSHFLHSCLSAMINWSLSQKIYFPSLQWLLLNFFCSKSIWDKSQFQVPTSTNSEKLKALLLFQLLKLTTWCLQFFWFFYFLVPKIECCLKYFLDKNPQKQL
jgi:hypothetical protein